MKTESKINIITKVQAKFPPDNVGYDGNIFKEKYPYLIEDNNFPSPVQNSRFFDSIPDLLCLLY